MLSWFMIPYENACVLMSNECHIALDKWNAHPSYRIHLIYVTESYFVAFKSLKYSFLTWRLAGRVVGSSKFNLSTLCSSIILCSLAGRVVGCSVFYLSNSSPQLFWLESTISNSLMCLYGSGVTGYLFIDDMNSLKIWWSRSNKSANWWNEEGRKGTIWWISIVLCR